MATDGAILLMDVGGYFINGYWWLVVVMLLVVIVDYFIMGH
jgi:hypothetical protein